MKNGVIIINKEIGPPSQGVVNRVKRLLGASKAGHTGTLDPMATGVLPVFLHDDNDGLYDRAGLCQCNDLGESI